ncbi:hypothetical protein PTD2_05220 [Pseudoalteromonas tunicata D2]|uniref:Uncharacterized protein n=1 Tax=Pseudoalteromonas tunicata D2 TaxID=87626 RepID=A4CDK2_9GAMM|nr:hypothetical protein PTD2_05220 [Pseudoalteromonas tunicata D2]
MGCIPYSRNRIASIYFYDADNCVPEHGVN